MYGAIIGDIAGCVYEFRRNKRYDFQPFMHPEGNYTDDTIMTVAFRGRIMVLANQGHQISPYLLEKLSDEFLTTI